VTFNDSQEELGSEIAALFLFDPQAALKETDLGIAQGKLTTRLATTAVRPPEPLVRQRYVNGD